MSFPAPNQIQTVIFDLGAVLLHWAPEEIARTFTDDPALQQRLLDGVFYHQHWQDMDQGLISEAEAIEQFARNCAVDSKVTGELMTLVRESLLAKPGTVRIMEDLKQAGYGIYGLSNICDELYTDMLSRHAFFEHFEDLVVSARVNMIKPSPDIFHYTLTRFSARPEQTLFIDDNAANIASASKLGIHSLLFTDSDSCRAQIHEIIRAA